MNKKEIEELNKKLEICNKEKEEYLDGWKRSKADFSNYKSSELERIKKISDYTEEMIISEIIEIADSFDMAEDSIPINEKENNDFVKGFLQIKNKLNVFFRKMEVQEIVCLGKDFDPNHHEAIEIVEAKGKSGTIFEEILKGYTRKGKLLRASKVRVIK